MYFGRKRKRSQWLGSALGAAGGIAGGAISGSPFGSEVGSRLGQYAGDLIKTFTGFGAYNIEKNSLYEGAQTPFVTNANLENAMVIAHREYLGNVVTSSNIGEFTTDEYTINPCDTKTFPWLSQIANQFEEWLPMGIVFFFKSTSGDALTNTNTALGNVMMASQYNVYQPDFTEKIEMENHAYNMSCKPSSNMLHPIECAPSHNQVSIHYTRPGGLPIPLGADQRLYDLCTTTIATEGMQAADVLVGELHIAYQIGFFKPRLWIYRDPGAAVELLFEFPNGENSATDGLFDTTDLEFRGNVPKPTTISRKNEQVGGRSADRFRIDLKKLYDKGDEIVCTIVNRCEKLPWGGTSGRVYMNIVSVIGVEIVQQDPIPAAFGPEAVDSDIQTGGAQAIYKILTPEACQIEVDCYNAQNITEVSPMILTIQKV